MKRLLLAALLATSALAQLWSPAELKNHIATNLPSGAALPARLLRETLTNIVTSTLFATNNLSDLDDVVAARDNLGLALGTNVMAFGTNLTALEGLTTVADRVPYFTGAATASLATFTAAGRALVDDADATAQRATLGLAIGSNVQAYDADLDSIAALTTTSFGRGLLDDADAAAGRASLGLGTLATQSGTFSGTSSGSNTGDQDLSSYATTAAVAAGYQPLDSDLTSIAALSTTSFGRGLLDDADASAGRASLGVVPGSDVQAYDADLTTYAGISPSASVQSLLGAATYQLFRIGLGVEPGTDVQAYDADLADLADGSLSGSKVGSGVDAGNLTSGTVAPARLGSGSGGSSKYLREDSTWQTIAGGGDALVANPLSQFAATTSAQLAGVISDESGTGAAVFAGGDVGAATATSPAAYDSDTSVATTSFVMTGGRVQVLALTSDAAANSTTTGVEITGLNKTTGTGTFAFQYFIRYQSGATSTGVRFGVNHTGTAAVFMATLRYQESTTAASTGAASQAAAAGTLHAGSSTRTKSTTAPNLASTASVDSANADMFAVIEGLVIVTATGDLELWHASEVAAASTVKTGTCLILTRVN